MKTEPQIWRGSNILITIVPKFPMQSLYFLNSFKIDINEMLVKYVIIQF